MIHVSSIVGGRSIVYSILRIVHASLPVPAILFLLYEYSVQLAGRTGPGITDLPHDSITL